MRTQRLLLGGHLKPRRRAAILLSPLTFQHAPAVLLPEGHGPRHPLRLVEQLPVTDSNRGRDLYAPHLLARSRKEELTRSVRADRQFDWAAAALILGTGAAGVRAAFALPRPDHALDRQGCLRRCRRGPRADQQKGDD